jgi:hypothetical protein
VQKCLHKAADFLQRDFLWRDADICIENNRLVNRTKNMYNGDSELSAEIKWHGVKRMAYRFGQICWRRMGFCIKSSVR